MDNKYVLNKDKIFLDLDNDYMRYEIGDDFLEFSIHSNTYDHFGEKFKLVDYIELENSSKEFENISDIEESLFEYLSEIIV